LRWSLACQLWHSQREGVSNSYQSLSFFCFIVFIKRTVFLLSLSFLFYDLSSVYASLSFSVFRNVCIACFFFHLKLVLFLFSGKYRCFLCVLHSAVALSLFVNMHVFLFQYVRGWITPLTLSFR
jgi:hypothetical protein